MKWKSVTSKVVIAINGKEYVRHKKNWMPEMEDLEAAECPVTSIPELIEYINDRAWRSNEL